MKRLMFFVTVVALVILGCEYQAPLIGEHTTPIDPAVLGLWEEVPEANQTADPDKNMLVLKYSDTEYLVQYPTGKDGMHFRAYPIEVAGIKCVQIQLIGAASGPVEEKDRKYHVVAYKPDGDTLEIRTLNSDVVSKEITDSAALRKAFEQNKDNPNLFHDPGVFRRVKK